MYWFGNKDFNQAALLENHSWDNLEAKKLALYQTPLEKIIDALDEFSQQWHPGQPIFEKAILPLIEETGLSRQEVLESLSLLRGLLSRHSLIKRLRGEFENPEILDRYQKTPSFFGKVKAIPHGVVLHVTAGNIFLSSIDSLIMGFLTKNLSVLKVSGQNKFFPVYFAETLKDLDKKNILSDKFAVLSWKGGDESIERFIKTKVNAIIAWGGEEMVSSYLQDLPLGVKLLDFGPKISFQLVSKKALDEYDLSTIAQRVCADIAPWDQSACASPQNLYLEESIDEKSFLETLEKAFENLPSRGMISADEAVEILKEKYRGLYSSIMEKGDVRQGEDFLLHFEENKFLRPSPLNRSLIIKKYKTVDELYQSLLPFRYYLQSCSYQLADSEKDSYLGLLALAGIKRFAPLGTITWGMEGAPHDGRYVLRELVQFVGDENRAQQKKEEFTTLSEARDLKTYFEEASHPRGYIFSTGGTTGEPKYIHYSYEEMDYMTDMLRENYEAQGIRPGMIIANLFVAGNLWSSFMAVDKAMQKLGAIQLPIGGLCPLENIVMYLQKFNPDVILGIPSHLVSVAEYAQSKNIKLKIKKVFYAGEALTEMKRQYLEKMWQSESISSAGYASVDAGVIGYQCSHSEAGVHHVFEDLVKASIIEEELVVTSVIRETMPVINYRTGDRAEWVDGACQCGRKDKRFKLLGRADNQIQIWSCRILLTDLEKVLQEELQEIKGYQVIIDEKILEGSVPGERLRVLCETENDLNEKLLVDKFYSYSRDVKDTISLDSFRARVQFETASSSELIHNERTGKTPLIIDCRRR